MPGKGGGGGGGAGGGATPAPKGTWGADGVDGLAVGDLAVSMALRGRGGAMVPKRMEASCLALPPVGRASSSEEESGSSLESTTDHSSSSGRTREGRELPVGVEERGGKALAVFSCWVRRWKGLVEISVAEADVVEEDEAWVGGGGPDSLDWLSFLKKGFLVSLL